MTARPWDALSDVRHAMEDAEHLLDAYRLVYADMTRKVGLDADSTAVAAGQLRIAEGSGPYGDMPVSAAVHACLLAAPSPSWMSAQEVEDKLVSAGGFMTRSGNVHGMISVQLARMQKEGTVERIHASHNAGLRGSVKYRLRQRQSWLKKKPVGTRPASPALSRRVLDYVGTLQQPASVAAIATALQLADSSVRSALLVAVRLGTVQRQQPQPGSNKGCVFYAASSVEAAAVADDELATFVRSV